MRKVFLVLGAATGVLSALVFLATDLHSQPTGLIRACVNQQSGEIKILTKAGGCNPGHSLLEWAQGGAIPATPLPLQLVDSAGTHIGIINVGNTGVSETLALRINGVVIGIEGAGNQVGTNGFVNNPPPTSIAFYHTSADCSGPRYLPRAAQTTADGADFVLEARINANILYYAGNPMQELQTKSTEKYQNATDDVSQPGLCVVEDGGGLFGPVATVNLNSLGFVPPFRVE